jgi:hypothetical protein
MYYREIKSCTTFTLHAHKIFILFGSTYEHLNQEVESVNNNEVIGTPFYESLCGGLFEILHNKEFQSFCSQALKEEFVMLAATVQTPQPLPCE